MTDAMPLAIRLDGVTNWFGKNDVLHWVPIGKVPAMTDRRSWIGGLARLRFINKLRSPASPHGNHEEKAGDDGAGGVLAG